MISRSFGPKTHLNRKKIFFNDYFYLKMYVLCQYTVHLLSMTNAYSWEYLTVIPSCSFFVCPLLSWTGLGSEELTLCVSPTFWPRGLEGKINSTNISGGKTGKKIFFFLCTATSAAYGSSRARRQIGATHETYTAAYSKHQILNPLSKARDQTSSWIPLSCS